MTNPEYDARYEIRNEVVEHRLREIGREIRAKLPNGFGFTLMIFSYGEGGDFFYISSAMREDMIKMMEEFKQKLINDNKK